MLSSIITKGHTVRDTQPSSLSSMSVFCLILTFYMIDSFYSYCILYAAITYPTFGSSSALCRISLKQWLIKSQHSFKGGSKTILGSCTLSFTVSIWGKKNCISWYGSVKSLPSLGKRMKILHDKEIKYNYNNF